MKLNIFLLGILILFFILIIFWNFIIYKGLFENNDNESDQTDVYKIDFSPHRMGNYLCCFFYNMGLVFLNGNNYKTDVPITDDLFTNYFPKKILFDKSVQDAFISAGITKESLGEELRKIGYCDSAWQVTTKERETFWTIIKPTVNRVLKDALEKSNLNKPIDYPVIYFRCSDMPFVKSPYYHFQKYEFYKEALGTIKQQTGQKYEKVYICYCNTHNSSSENQTSCDKYFKSLTEYLKNLGYEVITKCQSVDEDFAMMFYAPAVISTTSSFSFMAGFFSDGVFISSMYDERQDKDCDDCGDWYQKGYTLKHADVADYHDTDTVISMLKYIDVTKNII